MSPALRCMSITKSSRTVDAVHEVDVVTEAVTILGLWETVFIKGC